MTDQHTRTTQDVDRHIGEFVRENIAELWALSAAIGTGAKLAADFAMDIEGEIEGHANPGTTDALIRLIRASSDHLTDRLESLMEAAG
ncbi:hypothetical protein [Thiocystis violacea]|uniref:hypothetical protein n=1 Tax=Thiocystis violacea TaxID=13725 RepID=UPI0019036746|nr:hypothetical protein [Thiocystis violacea]MBK1716844.1 hypothetical protein [Thiocystis violacea]